MKIEGRSPYRYSGVPFVQPMECDVSIRFLYLQPSRGPHESIITSFKKLHPSFLLLRTVKCRFLARAFVRASNALARVMSRAKFNRLWLEILLYSPPWDYCTRYWARYNELHRKRHNVWAYSFWHNICYFFIKCNGFLQSVI